MAEKSRIVNVLATKCDRTEIRKTRLRVRMLKMVRIARMLKMVSLARMIQMVRLVSARGARIANRNRIRIMLLVETGSCHPSSGHCEAAFFFVQQFDVERCFYSEVVSFR